MSRTLSQRNDRGEVAHLYDDPFQTIESRMNQMFRGLYESMGREAGMASYPVDIVEDENQIKIEAEMPGFKSDEIDINVENGVLTIIAERSAQAEDKSKKRHLTERCFTRTRRAFTLPRTVDGSEVEASLHDGILTLTLQKTEESKPRKIQINNGAGK